MGMGEADLTTYGSRTLGFLGRYIRGRAAPHAAVAVAVVAAVTCSVTTQYGVKRLVDALSAPSKSGSAWLAFCVLLFFIAADNLFWRVAGLIASFTFVRVTGDIRADLFRHLTGHATNYFAKRMPGMLTSRVTATSNAVFTIENMFVFNVAPPCLATVGAIGFLAMVNVWMAGILAIVSCGMIVVIFPDRRGRQTVASRLRRQSRVGRWRNGGRHRQYLARESVRGSVA